MDQVLLDTSVLVAALRRPESSPVSSFLAGEPLWLSAVVLEELYAGSRTEDRRVLETLEQAALVAGRLLLPNLQDWKNTGLLLAKVGERFGYEEIGRGRLTNDALIATGAARTGLVVLTANQRDFSRLAELLPLRWRFVDLQ